MATRSLASNSVGAVPSDALSWVSVDLGKLAGNVSAVLRQTAHGSGAAGDSSAAGGAVVCGVVKKNAYGLGAVSVARAMQRSGCGMLAVYAASEAEELVGAGLANGKACPILVLMPVSSLDRRDLLYRAAVAGGLHLTVHSRAQAEALDEAGRRLGLRLPVHVHVDTGMSREGMGVDEAAALWPALLNMRGLAVAGLMSHLATADVEDGEFSGFAEEQESAFDGLVERLATEHPGSTDGLLLHTGNSWAVWRSRKTSAEAAGVRHVVRPGLGLYGYAGDVEAGVRPIVRWCSKVSRVRRQPAGVTVGYGATARLERDSVLGLVPAGYGDGYPLGLSNRGKVVVTAAHEGADGPSPMAVCRVVGRVNMDQIVIDLTTSVEQAGLPGEAWLGAEVELYGDDPAGVNAIPRLAASIESHAYELLCRLNPRVPRIYTG